MGCVVKATLRPLYPQVMSRYPLYRRLGVKYGNVKKQQYAVGFVRIKLVSLMGCALKTYKFKHEYSCRLGGYAVSTGNAA